MYAVRGYPVSYANMTISFIAQVKCNSSVTDTSLDLMHDADQPFSEQVENKTV